MSVVNLVRPIHEGVVAGWTLPTNYLQGDLPDWYGKALGDAALLVDGEEVVFADGYATGQHDEDHTAHLLIFTKSLLVAVVAETIGGEVSRTTLAHRRSDLVQLGVQTGVSALADHFGNVKWPGRVTVELSYKGGQSYALPSAGSGSTYHAAERMQDFIPSLRRDLLSDSV
ncbi:hypothetical protein GCM10009718_02550 [Isoptericola halotolerans]|uniref:Uncharacterized protein n=1 Tax=Isoptericola halotolerans TaxID=300560 RepID=A0ABX2A1U3_9MICO|nr:hypothetical protein [Isoptericola halotolerans]NOV96817.1 hypothetical protein [Isoptericola halotolerans]